MLNKITGWLIFVQLGYVSLLMSLLMINSLTEKFLTKLISPARDALRISSSDINLGKILREPIAYTTIINSILAVIFLWVLLRMKDGFDYTKNFFCIINVIYVTASSWLSTIVLYELLD